MICIERVGARELIGRSIEDKDMERQSVLRVEDAMITQR
jgi:hypothetical protein